MTNDEKDSYLLALSQINLKGDKENQSSLKTITRMDSKQSSTTSNSQEHQSTSANTSSVSTYPQTLKEIFYISNNNRKKNKQRKKGKALMEEQNVKEVQPVETVYQIIQRQHKLD